MLDLTIVLLQQSFILDSGLTNENQINHQNDCSLLHSNKELCDTFTISLKNRFNVLQSETIETVSTNQAYQHFENACKLAASECIPLKPKDNRVPWDTALVQNKRNVLKKAAVLKNSNPTRTNITKHNKA